MKLRKEQIDALSVPSRFFGRGLCELLHDQGVDASLDPVDGALWLYGPIEGRARIQFDQRGRPDSVTAISGRCFNIQYDQDGHINAIVDVAGNRTNISIDDANQLTHIIRPSGARYEFVYDSGLPVEIRRSGTKPIRMSYDSRGNLTALIDGKEQWQRFEYDSENRLVAFTDRLGAAIRFAYRPDGSLTSVINPNGSEWRSNRDDAHDCATIVFPDGSAEVHRPRHLPTEFRRRDGQTVRLQYDSRGNVMGAQYPGDLVVSLSYGPLGHLKEAMNGLHDVRIEYDAMGLRCREDVGGRRIALHRSQDRLAESMENHWRDRVQFEYAADRRVERIRDWDGQEYFFSHDVDGRLTRIALPGGFELQHTYSDHGILLSQQLLRRGRETITRAYEYDANDVLTKVADSEHGAKEHWTDAEDHLIGVKSRHATRSYAYDSNGNIVVSGSRRCAYDAMDRIVQCTDRDYSYDGLGNVVSTSSQGRVSRYSYNGQNQLVAVELPDGRVAEYEYDALGRRIVKRFAGVTTTFSWWGDQLVAEDSTGARKEHVDYLFLPGTSRLLAMRVNGETFFAETDHLASPIRIVNRSGNVVWAAEPHAYEYLILVNRIRQPFRFPGQYFDEETGLHYNRHRYYDPTLGRYLSPDPLGYKDRANLYQYAGGNPALFADPSGLFLPLLILGALAIGAAFGAGHAIASDLSQGKDVDWKNAGKAAGKGVLVAAGGLLAAGIAVLTLPATAPAAAVLAIGALGATATSAIIGAASAPEGERATACMEAVPFVRQFTHDYEHDPSLRYPTAQRVLDASFDLLGLALMGLGLRAAKGKTVGAIRPSTRKVNPSTLERLGPESEAQTNRPAEHPYHNPPEMIIVEPGTALDLSKLDPNRTYVWTMDKDGRTRIAPTDQPDFLKTKQGKQTEVKHGDLNPGEDGKSRGPACAGGELRAIKDSDGNPTGMWELNNDSSYTFNRADGKTTTGANLQAVSDVLGEGGTDTSKILVNNNSGAE